MKEMTLIAACVVMAVVITLIVQAVMPGGGPPEAGAIPAEPNGEKTSSDASEELPVPEIRTQRVATWAAALSDEAATQLREFAEPLELKPGEGRWKDVPNVGDGETLTCSGGSLVGFINESLRARTAALSHGVYYLEEMRALPPIQYQSFGNKHCARSKTIADSYEATVGEMDVIGALFWSAYYWLKFEEAGARMQIHFSSGGFSATHFDTLPRGECWLFLLSTKRASGKARRAPWHLFVVQAVELTAAQEQAIAAATDASNRIDMPTAFKILSPTTQADSEASAQ